MALPTSLARAIGGGGACGQLHLNVLPAPHPISLLRENRRKRKWEATSESLGNGGCKGAEGLQCFSLSLTAVTPACLMLFPVLRALQRASLAIGKESGHPICI